MSISRNKKRKAKHRARTEYEKSIARKIKTGKLPRFYLAKTGDRLERTTPKKPWLKPGVSLKQVGTMQSLTKEGGEK